jgi:hypothetical protein
MLPVAYYAYGSGLLGEFALILEDVTLSKVAPVNFVFGNQIWGIPKPLDPPLDPLVVLEAMYLRAAEQHAKFWKNRTLLTLPWLKGANWYGGRGRAEWELTIERGRQAWETAKASATGAKFSLKLIAIIDQSFVRASWKNLQARLHNPAVPFTLCHGDFHAANMLVRTDIPPVTGTDPLGVDVVMFDWSECGPWEPTTDLVQTLISDVKAELFTKHSKTLVHKYWTHLVAHGVSAQEYTFEACWSAFCSTGPSRWIWVFAVLASFPGMPAAAVMYFHDQLLAFIEAHGDQPHYELGPAVLML